MKNHTLIALLMTLLIHTHVFSAPTGSGPSPQFIENFDTGISAKCVKANGTVYSLENVNNPVFNNQIYNARKLRQGPDKHIINPNNVIEWTVDGCKNPGDELDAFASADADPQNFGTGTLKMDNINLIRTVKLKKKANRFLFIYTRAPDGTPLKYFHPDTKSYAVVGLDPTGKMDDNNLRDISGIRITSGPFNLEDIGQNVQDILDSGLTKVDENALKTQFTNIEQLGLLYTKNINNAKNWLAGLKNAGKYEDINNKAQTILNFLNSANIGFTSADQTKLQDIEKLNIEFSTIVNKLRLSKDNINGLLNQMNTIAKEIPGNDPASLEDRLKDPKKYTLVARLISDALGDDKNAINIFYALDDWTAKAQAFTDRLNQLKSTKNNFLPKLNQKISTLMKTIDSVKNERINFEKSLKTSIAAGKGDVNNIVHAMYDKLRQDITDLNTFTQDVQNLINSGKNIQDEKFQASLNAEVVRFQQLLPDIKALESYAANQLPKEMHDAYNKSQDQTTKPITDIIAEANTHIAQLETALKPVFEALNANQDANQVYTAAKGSITAALDFLSIDETKLNKLVSTVADEQIKKMIVTTQSNIETEKNRVNQVLQLVGQSAINDHIHKADIVKTSITTPTGDFKKAYTQYLADKKQTPTTSPANLVQEYNKVYNLMQEVVPLLKTDLTNMSATDKRKQPVTTYIASKTTGGSLANIVQSAATLLSNQGIQVQQVA